MTDFKVNPDLLCIIPAEKHSVEDITNILDAHPEIKFVSLAAVDLAGNDTDERIPIADFHDNLQNYLNGQAVQTDGSSVVLPESLHLTTVKSILYLTPMLYGTSTTITSTST